MLAGLIGHGTVQRVNIRAGLEEEEDEEQSEGEEQEAREGIEYDSNGEDGADGEDVDKVVLNPHILLAEAAAAAMDHEKAGGLRSDVPLDSARNMARVGNNPWVVAYEVDDCNVEPEEGHAVLVLVDDADHTPLDRVLDEVGAVSLGCRSKGLSRIVKGREKAHRLPCSEPGSLRRLFWCRLVVWPRSRRT